MALGYTVWIMHSMHLVVTVSSILFAVGLALISLVLLYSIWFLMLTNLIWFTNMSNLVVFCILRKYGAVSERNADAAGEFSVFCCHAVNTGHQYSGESASPYCNICGCYDVGCVVRRFVVGRPEVLGICAAPLYQCK